MKKILTVSILFFSMGVHAQIDTTKVQGDTSGIKFIDLPDSTAVGIPDGKLVSKEIGPAGGTIVSEDGRVELIFPTDALTANTSISIQPTTNLAPNGAGKAYQFEPSGIQFRKPVQIIFHYTDEEAEICPPGLMGFAMQDQTGKWSFFDYDDWDSAAKILKGTIEHFSGAAPHVSKLKLVPGKRTIMVNEQTSVSIADMFSKFKGEQKILSASLNWSVNGIQFGNNSTGTISDIKATSCNYKAPSLMPDPNPVSIKVEIFISSTKNKSKLYIGKCEVEVYDGYEIKVAGKWTYFTPDNDDLKLDITETSSCTLEIETTGSGVKWKLGNKRNDQPLVTIVKCPKECNCNPTNRDFRGIVEIDGITTVRVVDKKVTVSFERANAEFPLMITHCKGTRFPLMPQFPTVPSYIQFDLTGVTQLRKFSYGENVFPIEYVFVIKRLSN